jgi:hypothetical protein
MLPVYAKDAFAVLEKSLPSVENLAETIVHAQ